ncbi:hypothetical protein Acr_08g0008080 [Actinidia rufa]|uniref:Uncharacterized protein n=1 Tax=Actinidia rufa TaxID=165716 RepID=A0A7J0F154_9ERIC|nr:hypothetical protein Acr_08g0008080 [Actinidia rufa]
MNGNRRGKGSKLTSHMIVAPDPKSKWGDQTYHESIGVSGLDWAVRGCTGLCRRLALHEQRLGLGWTAQGFTGAGDCWLRKGCLDRRVCTGLCRGWVVAGCTGAGCWLRRGGSIPSMCRENGVWSLVINADLSELGVMTPSAYLMLAITPTIQGRANCHVTGQSVAQCMPRRAEYYVCKYATDPTMPLGLRTERAEWDRQALKSGKGARQIGLAWNLDGGGVVVNWFVLQQGCDVARFTAVHVSDRGLALLGTNLIMVVETDKKN